GPKTIGAAGMRPEADRCPGFTAGAGVLDDLLREYLTETRENLSVLEADLVTLEQGPDDPVTLGNIFRLMHNIKGTSGFLRLPAIESLAHTAEGVLACLRSGSLAPTPKTIETLKAAVVQIGEILAYLEREGREPADVAADIVPALSALTQAAPEKVPGPEGAPARGPSVAAPAGRPAESRGILRIGADRLDRLAGLVSEIAVAHDGLRAGGAADAQVTGGRGRLNSLVSALQDACHDLRTRSAGAAWEGLPVFAGALADRFGKKVDLVLRGADTRIAGELVEVIKDPLVHMVRNAIDHGLETPEERRAAGKPAAGRIIVEARAEPGRVVIEVGDDGRGLDLGRIKAKARALGLAEPADFEAMDEAEIARLVFVPGLSTSESVTRLSGRGVGMDIVRTNVERAGGGVAVATVAGEGTRITITLPVREAHLPVLTVESRGETFALPLSGVLELVRVAPGGEARIERLFDTSILRQGSRLLPLIELSGLLGLDGGTPGERDKGAVVVIQAGSAQFGLLVDRVTDAREVAVMALPPLLAGIDLYAGGMSLEDGTIALVLDPPGLARAAGIEATVQRGADAVSRASSARPRGLIDLLVLRRAEAPAKAVPLALVARVEDIEGLDIDVSEGRATVLSRGVRMPLLGVDGAWAEPCRGRQRIVVCGEGARAVGLLAGRGLDLVEAEIRLDGCERRSACLGTAEIADMTVEVIDPGQYLEGDRDSVPLAASPAPEREVRRVLLIDDNPFFRQFLPPLLSSAGYLVTTVDSSEQARDLCEAGETFDAILSDVDLPAVREGDLTETVKASGNWRETPVVALSSDPRRDTGEGAPGAGFERTVGKFDRGALLRALHDTLTRERGAA
ncbi:MAG: chemotaxis protein CheW, partial [Kiloniellales bacterium]